MWPVFSALYSSTDSSTTVMKLYCDVHKIVPFLHSWEETLLLSITCHVLWCCDNEFELHSRETVNMDVSFAGLGTKNECAGEDQQ
jgi:hypothetical protein